MKSPYSPTSSGNSSIYSSQPSTPRTSRRASLEPLGSGSTNNTPPSSARSFPPSVPPRINPGFVIRDPTKLENLNYPHELTFHMEEMITQIEARFDNMSSLVLEQMMAMSSKVDELEASLQMLVQGAGSDDDRQISL